MNPSLSRSSSTAARPLPRAGLAALLLWAIAAPATAQLNLGFTPPTVSIADGSALDACPSPDQICLGAPIVSPGFGYTITGTCLLEQFIGPLGVRIILSDCTVTKDPPAGPISVSYAFESSFFPPQTLTDYGAALDAEFIDNGTPGNVSVQYYPGGNPGPWIPGLGPLVPPPSPQLAVSALYPWTGTNQLYGTVNITLEDVGDAVTLPNSVQLFSGTPASPVPAFPLAGALGTGALLLIGALVALRSRAGSA